MTLQRRLLAPAMALRTLTHLTRVIATLAAATLTVFAQAETPGSTLPTGSLHSPPAFSTMAPGPVAKPWRLAGLPKQTKPLTQIDVVVPAGTAVLRLRAQASYGNLVFDTPHLAPSPQLLLRWDWRLERGLERSDLTSKEGDDTPVKVCALFDLPLDGLALGERTRLIFARAISGEHLPAATLCYVWDRALPVGSTLANAYTSRVRYIVLSSGPARPGVWVHLERNLAADFLRTFGHESATVPPLLAIAVGADTDNSAGDSLAYVGDISLAP